MKSSLASAALTASLRGHKLRAHLATLSAQYWPNGTGVTSEAPGSPEMLDTDLPFPKSVTKRRGSTRRHRSPSSSPSVFEFDENGQFMSPPPPLSAKFTSGETKDEEVEGEEEGEEEIDILSCSSSSSSSLSYEADDASIGTRDNVSSCSENGEVVSVSGDEGDDESTKVKVAAFKKARIRLTGEYFDEFNKSCFDSRLPNYLSVTWSKRLLTTAGITRLKMTSKRASLAASELNKTMSHSGRISTIELSEKVVDSEERLKNTLLHEMCHAGKFGLRGQFLYF